MKREALRATLAARMEASEVVVLEAIELSEPKTRLFQELLDTVGLSGNLLLVLGEHDARLYRSGRNIAGLEITTASDVTAYELMSARTLVLTKEAVTRLEARVA